MASSKKKKTAPKAAKKAAPKKSSAPKKTAKAAKPAKAKSAAKPKKPAAKAVKSSAPPKPAARAGANGQRKARVRELTPTQAILGNNHKQKKLDPFTKGQREKLLYLRDAMVDSMAGVAKDNLRSRAEGSEASAFGMHQADAGSDAYDRDFALSLLSQEQDALYEIDQALKRIDLGTYGVCEMSGKPISHARLDAIPFARFTVECQSQLEKQNKASRVRQSVTSLFGLTDDDSSEGEEEESKSDRDDNKD
ncbi:MAG: TraR/DksA C4-type zinc finger protein [Chthoniobacterales bacterium]